MMQLQHPKVLAKAGDITIRLTVAGERSKTPGAINVTAAESSGLDANGFARRDWYGRITAAGEYTGSPQHPQTAIIA
jgi:hypothetical protein